MADNWDTVFSNRASRDYSRLPTQTPSEHSRHSIVGLLDDGDYSPGGRSTRASRKSVQVASLGKRVSLLAQAPAEDLSPASPPASARMSMGRASTEQIVANPISFWRFVDRSWFQAISAVVIISNVITTIVEMDKPQTKKLFFISDQVMLAFYVLELCSRANYFGNMFLLGPWKLVGWNVLDIIVVVAGVLDQWLMPLLPGGKSRSVSKVLNLLRLLRLLRVFKIVRVFLDIDLSWTEQPTFQSFIGIVIMVNSLLMGMEIDIEWGGWWYFEQVLLCIYVFELSVRLKNFGRLFFSCDNADIVWNVLDFIIVSSSVLDSWLTPLFGIIMKSLSGAKSASHSKEQGMSLGKVMMLMRMLRLMRILRLAKLVKSIQPLFILVTGVMAALQGVAWVLVLTIVTLYAMGILATSLIGKKMGFPPGADVPEEILRPFSTVPNSMFTLFRVMSGAASDAEQVAIDDLMDNVPAIKLGFVFFMITSSWTLLSILTAVVSDNMISTTGQQEEEIKIQNAEEDRIEQVEMLTELFNAIDVRGDGQVEQDAIEEFLSDRSNALLTARRCRVPVRDVRAVLQTVVEASEGSTVSIATFVDHLCDVSTPVTEKSIMKMESMLTNFEKNQRHAWGEVQNMLTNVWHSVSQLENSVSQLENDRADEAPESKDEAVDKGQPQDVASFMQGLTERTETCLHEIRQKHQQIIQSMAESLEQALPKLGLENLLKRLELQLCRSCQESGTPAARHEQAIVRDSEEQPSVVNKNQTKVGDIARTSSVQLELLGTHMDTRLLAMEESIHGLQQSTESMLRKIEGPLEKMAAAADNGLSAQAVDRHELLRCIGQQGQDISKVSAAEGNQEERLPVCEAGLAKAPSVCMEAVAPLMEARLLATEESMQHLQHKTDAMFKQVEGLLDRTIDHGSSALAVEKFSDTLERELRMMRQELLCSLGVSKVRDRLSESSHKTEQD